jgi:hypothetical protein
VSRQKVTTLYQFDELSDKAKERARDWYRGCRDSNDFEYIIEDADRMAAILGISIRRHPVKLMGGSTRQDPSIWWSLGYCQSDGAWIEADYAYAKQAPAAIRREAPEDTVLHAIADQLYTLQKAYSYQLTASIKDDDRRPMDLSVDHPTREAIPEEVYKAFREIVQDFERWIYKQLRTEDEYQSADAQVDEHIRANEYEFDTAGNRED